MTTFNPPTASGMNQSLETVIERLAQARQMAADAVPASIDGVEVADLHRALLTIRGAQDRAEGLLSSLAGLRRQAERRHLDAKQSLEDAWAEAATTPQRSSAVSEPSPRERYSIYDMATIAERRGARQTESQLKDVQSVADYASTVLRGIDGTRRDIHVLISARSIASRLES
jgi:hypothetical protein